MKKKNSLLLVFSAVAAGVGIHHGFMIDKNADFSACVARATKVELPSEAAFRLLKTELLTAEQYFAQLHYELPGGSEVKLDNRPLRVAEGVTGYETFLKTRSLQGEFKNYVFVSPEAEGSISTYDADTRVYSINSAEAASNAALFNARDFSDAVKACANEYDGLASVLK